MKDDGKKDIDRERVVVILHDALEAGSTGVHKEPWLSIDRLIDLTIAPDDPKQLLGAHRWAFRSIWSVLAFDLGLGNKIFRDDPVYDEFCEALMALTSHPSFGSSNGPTKRVWLSPTEPSVEMSSRAAAVVKLLQQLSPRKTAAA